MRLYDGLWWSVGQNLALAEFVYNKSYHSSIDMAPFEAFYGRCCHYLISWFDASKIIPEGTNLFYETLDSV